MHDYAVFGHDRANIGRWLGVTSILLAGGLAQLFALLGGITGWDAFSKATITTGVIYLGLAWLFNKCVWKTNWFGIPDINGVWKVEGKALDEDGNTKYEWNADLDIEQSWRQIAIRNRTSKSHSESYTATISKRSGARGGWLLSYSYRNEPDIAQSHELNQHKGFCEIEFDKDLKVGKASYFNSNGRRTYGAMQIKREATS